MSGTKRPPPTERELVEALLVALDEAPLDHEEAKAAMRNARGQRFASRIGNALSAAIRDRLVTTAYYVRGEPHYCPTPKGVERLDKINPIVIEKRKAS